ncbi:LigA [Rhodotorula toruloides]|nr:LigA [Rhodotorula toruloides]
MLSAHRTAVHSPSSPQLALPCRVLRPDTTCGPSLNGVATTSSRIPSGGKPLSDKLTSWRLSPPRHRTSLLPARMSSPPTMSFSPAHSPSTHDLRLTSAHTKEPELVETMSADEDLAKLRTYFPSVYDRFASADPGREDPAHPFRCRYGIFPLFCLNYATNSPVHCVEHVDYKNVAGGVCAVLAYGDFDSTKSHYLVFHDLKLAIEFPAGTLALYPSSLLAHSNVSLVEVDSKEDALAGKGQKRGSLVWFAQANYIVSREIGMSLKRAKEKGLPTTYEGLYEHFRTEKGERGVEVVDV